MRVDGRNCRGGFCADAAQLGVAAEAAAAVAAVDAHSASDVSESDANLLQVPPPRLNDTFNDHATLSTSPGFVSEFLDDGTARWAEASTVELGREGDGGAASVDWEAVAALSFADKWKWLLSQLEELQVPWDEGHVRLTVRREHLLADSVAQFNALPAPHLHRWLRVDFEGEPAIDAGGLEREWFQLCV